MITLGSKVQDSITGFSGIATARTLHLYGCVHIGVAPTELRDGKPVETQVFDEQRMKLVQPHPKLPGLALEMLGCQVKDEVTGFAGIVTSAVEYFRGPVVVAVTSETLHEGKPIEPVWFDAGRVQVTAPAKREVSPASTATSGGPGQLPTSICR